MKHLRLLALTLFAALLFMGNTAVTTTTAATTFNVTDAASLIQAIEDANDETTYPGADVIDLGGNTVTFRSSYADYKGATALPQITSEVTIQNGILDNGIRNTRLLYVDATGILTTNNMTLQDGYTIYGFQGLGIYNIGTLYVNKTTFDNYMQPREGTAGELYGAAIANYSSITITDSTFTNNQADSAVHSRGPTVIINSDFRNNLATTGGALQLETSAPKSITGSTFESNGAFFWGGAIFNERESVLDITGTTFTNNWAETGGAIYNYKRASLTITDSTFHGNETVRDLNTPFNDGGAISNDAGSLRIFGSTFSQNFANNDGGAIEGNVLEIKDSTFTSNATNYPELEEDARGGAIYGFVREMQNTSLRGNEAYSGGAVYGGLTTVTNSLLSGNYAKHRGGALRGSIGTMTNVTITGNAAPDYPAFYQVGTNVTLRNNIIWGNGTKSDLSRSYRRCCYYDTITISDLAYNIFQGRDNDATNGNTNNSNANPLFVNPVSYKDAPTTAGDYRLHPYSPAIDAGSNSAANTVNIGMVDLAQNGRFSDDIGIYDRGEGNTPQIDLGAFEFQATTDCTAYSYPYTVTGGTSDLIRAIQCANFNATDDVIDLNGSTVTFSTPYGLYPAPTALPTITTPLTLQNGTLDGAGTGLRLLNTGSESRLLLDNMQLINGGSAELRIAGAIYNIGTLTITNSALRNNTAELWASAIYTIGDLTLIDSTIADNTSQYSTVASAGVITTVDNSLFVGNNGSALAVGNRSVRENDAHKDLLGELLLTNSTFTENSGEVGSALSSSALATVENTVFHANTATNKGGAIHNMGTMTLSQVEITDNTAPTGGGIVQSGQEVTLVRSSVTGNQATMGGGIAVTTNSQFNLTKSIVAGNVATELGGGLHNTALTIIDNSLISGNIARNGSAIYTDDYLYVQNTTIAGNDASESGSIFNTDEHVAIYNSIVWGNRTDVVQGSGFFGLFYNIIEWNTRNGTLDVNPRFIAPEPYSNAPTTAGDYRLLAGSPAIDSGQNRSDTQSLDLAGNSRFIDVPAIADTGSGNAPIVDRGAYEYLPVAMGLDLNDDGIISPSDAAYVINRLNNGDFTADVDGDGDIDEDDLNAVYDALGTAP